MRYSIGLDIGVSSVGFACINERNEIIRFQGKPAFGVREFESGQTAEKRRFHRNTHRKYNRRKKRIQLLQMLFEPHVPNGFFSKKNRQHFWQNGNDFENKMLPEVLRSLLMNTKEIPTIYHLRKMLMTSTEKQHVRLIYLAIHNLTKYRGHFLNAGRWTKHDARFDFLTECSNVVTAYCDMNHVELPQIIFSDVQQIMDDEDMLRKEKVKMLEKMTSKALVPLWNLFLGLSVDVAKLFSESNYADIYKDEKVKIVLGSDELEEVREIFTDAENAFIDEVFTFYQQLMLQDFLQGHECVAFAKVASYEQYQEDLRALKDLVNSAKNKALYRKLFLTRKRDMTNYKNKPTPKHLHRLCLLDRYIIERFPTKKEMVLKEMMAAFEAAKLPEGMQLIEQIKEGTFLVYQNDTYNAAIPYQNSIYEIEAILNNQKQHHVFITDEFIEKVIQIVSFRIPYYIGPLSKNDASSFGWIERKAEGNITPFNYTDMIDESASTEKFIKRMTNKCTFLHDQDVLPKQSLLYQRYEVLNELNGVQIRPATASSHRKYRLPIEAKRCVIEHGFKKYKTMTHKRLLQVLKAHGFDYLIEDQDETYKVFGTANEDRFASSMSSYIEFQTLFADSAIAFDEAMVEQLIEWLTVFPEKSIIKTKITEQYPFIADALVEKLVKKQFIGWGRLSKKLLTDMKLADGQTVMDKLENTTLNFNEIKSVKRSNLEELMKQYNKPAHATTRITYKDIEALAGSPALKRGIWQAIKIIEELTEIFGEPTHIMLEVAREESTKKRSIPRYAKFKVLIGGLGKADKALKQALLPFLKEPASKFKNNRFYLYLLQQGKCVYSGKSLDVQRLSNYDIDHIYPQNFVKDDSLDNLVLVEKSRNQGKGGFKMPLETMSAAHGTRMKLMWKDWLYKGFISEVKYRRLMKPTFSDIDREAFIARQLVETRQIIKNVGVLLEERFSETSVRLVKAPIVTQFRKALEIPKLRDLNNKHHAMDALLCVSLINHAIQRYGDDIFAFSFKNKERSAKLAQIAQQYQDFFLFKSFVKETIISPTTKEAVSAKQFMSDVYYDLDWQTTRKVGSSEAMFFDETLHSPKIEEAKYESAKTSLAVNKGVKMASIAVVKYVEQQKDKQIEKVELVNLGVLESKQWQQISNDEKALRLVRNAHPKKEIVSAKWLVSLHKYQKILWRKQPYYLVSFKELYLGKQFVLPKDLLQAYLSVNEETSSSELQILYEAVADEMFKQYPVYAEGKMPEKIAEFKDEIADVDLFKKHISEIFKATANSPVRSELLGSRLNRAINVDEMKIMYESVTGLRSRKAKRVMKY